MNPFSMTVLIVLIIAVAKVMSRRYQALGQQQQVVPSADAMRAQDEIRQLKERVAVLERVVTDSHGSIGLDREIERLRDR
jgi:cytochrome c-type biogenesis protein CcmH/NrfG